MNIEKLTGIIPNLILQALTPDFLLKAGIDGPNRLSHFLGQMITESNNFSKVIENLNYSAVRLASVWPGRYAIDPHAEVKEPNELALKIQHDPVAIANNCYCNRNGNGDEESGDGYKYRGRGPIQLTGLDAYQGFKNWMEEDGTNYIDIMNNPDYVSNDIHVGLLSSVWFFGTSKKLWPVCDEGIGMEVVKKVTHAVNGGYTGLQDRFDHTQKIHEALTS